MKRISITILIIAALATTIMADCSKKCSSCGIKDNAPFCFICENSMWNNGSCSGNAPSNCLYHSVAGCLTCVPGYSLSKDNFKCTKPGKNAIKNCAVQWSQTNYDGSVTHACNVCNGSAPSTDQTSCSGKIPDGCSWGGIDNKMQINCAKCSAMGQVSVQGTCVGSYIPGCQISNSKGKCIQCLSGWNMTLPGVCSESMITQKM